MEIFHIIMPKEWVQYPERSRTPRFGNVAVYGEGKNQLVAVEDFENDRVLIYKVSTNQLLGELNFQSGSCSSIALAYSADGSLYVGDVNNDNIHVFSPELEFKYSFGGKGKEPGQFDWPNALAFTSQGYLLVSDYENKRVQVLSENREFVQFLEISPGNHTIDRPTDVCVAPSGHILVTSTFYDRVLIFDDRFQFVGSLGGPGKESGQFLRINSAAVSPDGTVVVADGSSVQVFKILFSDLSGGFQGTRGEPDIHSRGAERPIVQPLLIGKIDGFSVGDVCNVRVDKNGDIFTANGCDIIRIRFRYWRACASEPFHAI